MRKYQGFLLHCEPKGKPLKKLQDLFTDLHVPQAWRDSVPLLEGEMGISWVVGHRIANWAKVDQEADDPVLWIRFSPPETFKTRSP